MGSEMCIRDRVWAWHWARPGDGRVPWERAVRVGPRAEDGPVLPPGVLAHFARDHEVLLR